MKLFAHPLFSFVKARMSAVAGAALGILGGAAVIGATAHGMAGCTAVPVDSGPGNRVVPPAGVIQGTVLYQGPHPCSENGQIVGNLILLFFNQDDPPPPAGIASTAAQFGVVAGDVLFQNEPRSAGQRYCPPRGQTMTASAPFAVSPFAAGTYIVEAFYDYTGEFLPTFKFRELPEMGDVAGGYINTTDAILHADAGVDYKPIFLPITVGVPAGTVDAGAEAGVGVGPTDGGSLVIPPSGYVANNITVSVGSVLPIPRPYFYPANDTSPAADAGAGEANYAPAATMPQDIQILAQPPMSAITPADVMTFQNSLVSMKFLAGVPQSEVSTAIDPAEPFQFQLTTADDATSLYTWTDGTAIPENALLKNLLPQIVFTKLIDDPTHTLDPQSVTQQVPPNGPVVVVLGLTLPPSDVLLDLALGPVETAPGPKAATDHVTALIRPAAVCVDPTHPELGATFVAPHLTGTSAAPDGGTNQPLFDVDSVIAALTPIFGKINGPVLGCLPPGRYAPNFVYPTGQAWTVPNESGSCAVSEGTVQASSSSPTGWLCQGDAGPGRNVLYSQGTRGVLEITESPGSATCAAYPVPTVCGGP
jgi:hypothetical protein